MPLRISILVEDKIEKFINEAEEAQGTTEINISLALADELIGENPNHTQLLLTRAELYTRQQNFGKAVNDYRSILEYDSSNTKAKVRIEQLLLILKFQNTDIFESPNTNFDPWLD